MERHAAHPVLVRVFSGQEVEPEEETAVLHLPGCRPCWDLAVHVIAKLKREGRLAPSSAAAKALLSLLEQKQAGAKRWLLARSRRAELMRLPAHQQRERIQADPALRTLEMFSALVEEAASASREDPYLGEATASVAYALAGALPGDLYSEPLRNDLQAEALKVVGNCRRLAGDWRESAATCATARGHLLRGNGKSAREARLLSIEASLATDTGRLEQALELLGRSATLYSEAQDTAAGMSIRVKLASTLLAASRHEEAITRAEEALGELTPNDARLEMLARNIITESLVFLRRPDEALQSFRATQSLYKQREGRLTELQVGYLEALLLDAQGHAREAEKAFRSNIAGFMEAELYKEAFLHLVTFLQSLIRRGSFDKAARACEEALGMIERAGSGCHSQMIELWRSLLGLINARRLTEHQVLAARQYLVRHWNAPARHVPLEISVVRRRAEPPEEAPALPSRGGSENHDDPQTRGSRPGLRAGASSGGPTPAPTCHDGFEEAKNSFDRALIKAGLESCGRRIRETARLLKVSRNTLRDKMKKYGIEVEEMEPAPVDPGRPLPDKEIEALDRRLRARAWWGELKTLPRGQQLDRLQNIAALQTPEMCDAMLDEASTVAPDHPLRGEETALLAHTLAGLLPRRGRRSEAERNDLQAAALLVAADCRLLAGDGSGASVALEAARRHLARGSGGWLHEARFLSVQAGLLADTREIEPALALLVRAAVLHHKAQDPAAAASVTIQAATILRTAGRFEDAIARAETALRRLPPGEVRLELLARAIVIESLLFLDRPDEALHSLFAALPLFTELRSLRTELQLGFLEALLLEALGYERDAETAFRSNIARRLDAELPKDAFLTVMTRLEFFLGRGELDKATRTCEEALSRIEEAGMTGPVPIQDLWQALLALIRERAWTESHLLEARHALMRWGAASAHRTASRPGALRLPAWVTGGPVREKAGPSEPPVVAVQPPGRRLVIAEPPDAAESLAELGYKGALEKYSRQILAAGLLQARGDWQEAGRLLGLTPASLRARLMGPLADDEE